MQPPIILYRISRFFYRLYLRPLSVIFDYLNRLIFRCWIPGSAQIGKHFSVGYWGIGVVIHSKSVIGDHCQINQNVTIGKKMNEPGVPTLGDHVYVGANSVVLGNIRIGNNTIIGAMSLVNKDIPENCFAAGVPATVIRTNLAN